MVQTNQIVAGVLLVAYVAVGYILCRLERTRVNCYSLWYYPHMKLVQGNDSLPQPARRFEDRYCAGGYHGVLSLLGTLLIGFTILIFRLFRGIRTRTLKYFHFVLHVITLVLYSYGLWYIFIHENTLSYNRINYHGVTAWFVLVMFCFQFLAATGVFAYHYPNTTLRIQYAPFHDILGIWLFVCCVGCCISGKRRARLDYLENNPELFNGLSYVCFSFILIVILSPFFEWDLMGPL